MLTKSHIEQGFKLLGELADRDRLFIELFVVGGMAIVFGYKGALEKRNGVTEDVDVIFVQPADNAQYLVRRLVYEVGDRLGLSPSWLNDSVSKFVQQRSDGPVIFEGRGILVRRATTLQLLGMKLGLERKQADVDDNETLFDAAINELQPESPQQLWGWVKRYVPSERVKIARETCDEMWQDRYGKDHNN